jgi:hypothetical protein
MKFILIIASLFFLSPACSKRATNCCAMPDVEMTRKQTQCADAWGYGRNKDETITLLKNYLQKKNITTSKIDLLPTGETVLCLACNCSNGMEFHVWLQAQFTDSLKTEGFVIKQ